MKAQAVLMACEGIEADDRLPVDRYVEHPPVRPDGDVVVAAIGTDGRGPRLRVSGKPVCAPRRGAQLGHGMEVAVSQALPMHETEDELDLGDLFPKLGIRAVQPSAHQMRPYGALRDDSLHGGRRDRRDDAPGDGFLAHVLQGARDRDVLRLRAAVRPGALLPDWPTGQRDDLAAGHRAEFWSMDGAEGLPAPGDASARSGLASAQPIGRESSGVPQWLARCHLQHTPR